MHVPQLLHTTLKKSLPNMHSQRLSSLLDVANSLLHHGKLALSSLGRHMPSKAKVKHKIKKVDRLLGNGQLRCERIGIYRSLAHQAIGAKKRITVLVDWSPCAQNDNQLLKASLALAHRSVTLYEEVHPIKKLGKYAVHKAFLAALKKVLPSDVEVLIITDSGFRTEWFDLVFKQGWHFEGRIRTNMNYSKNKGKSWLSCRALYKQATDKVKYIGKVWLTKGRKYSCEMYLYKEKPSKKIKRNYKRKGGKTIEAYRKAYKDPWLLVTSLPHTKNKEKWVVEQYRLRMKIEHEFRDTKDSKWGIGFRYTQTLDPKRLEILLLIAAVALFMLWLIGLHAEKNKWQYAYQANTVKSYRVLSLVFLGLQVLTHEPERITEAILSELLRKEIS